MTAGHQTAVRVIWVSGTLPLLLAWPPSYNPADKFDTLLLLVSRAPQKYHKLGGLNNRSLFSHSFGGWKSNIRVQVVGFH